MTTLPGGAFEVLDRGGVAVALARLGPVGVELSLFDLCQDLLEDGAVQCATAHLEPVAAVVLLGQVGPCREPGCQDDR